MLIISETPLRRVVTRGSAQVNGFFATRKNHSALVWESLNEFNLLRVMEVDPAVLAIFVQAVLMKVRIGGKLRLHYPDIAALTPFGWEIYEAKSDRDLTNPEVLDLAAAAASEAAVQGIARSATYPEPRPVTYTLVFERSLRREPFHTSMCTVTLQLHRHVPLELELRTVDLAARWGPLPALELAGLSKAFGGTFESILALVVRGRLRMNLQELVKPSSLVWTLDQYPFGPRVFDPLNFGEKIHDKN